MNSSASAQTSCEQLDLKTLNRKELDRALALRENIVWACEGRIRVVPYAIWSNAYEVLKMYEAMKEAGRVEVLPGTAGIITWESARLIFSLPKVELTLDPSKR